MCFVVRLPVSGVVSFSTFFEVFSGVICPCSLCHVSHSAPSDCKFFKIVSAWDNYLHSSTLWLGCALQVQAWFLGGKVISQTENLLDQVSEWPDKLRARAGSHFPRDMEAISGQVETLRNTGRI